jgi:hypothetical protein
VELGLGALHREAASGCGDALDRRPPLHDRSVARRELVARRRDDHPLRALVRGVRREDLVDDQRPRLPLGRPRLDLPVLVQRLDQLESCACCESVSDASGPIERMIIIAERRP